MGPHGMRMLGMWEHQDGIAKNVFEGNGTSAKG
jgi:hypothetical protein